MATPESLSPEQQELLALKSFVVAFISHGDRPFDEDEPLERVGLDASELKAPKSEVKGWRMAVNDCIEMSSHWSPERVSQADKALSKAGLVSLSEIRRRYWKRYDAIRSRGRIRNEIEFYLVAGVLADTSSGLSQEERLQLEAMSSAYAESAA